MLEEVRHPLTENSQTGGAGEEVMIHRAKISED